ncbi:MAG: hypothetical protein JW809_20260 [Pirellulales bacterium]|nr:hypothetical protein [Pirellulales bacterium]
MRPDCIDLKARFGRRYRLGRDESYGAERGPGGRARDPWTLMIPCRFGHLYPFDADLLAASVDGFPRVAGRLRALACCRVWQDGDRGELTVVFHVNDLAEVARIVRPRRRRRLSPEQRATLTRRLLALRQSTPHDPTGGQHTGRGRDAGTSGDLEGADRQRALFGP